MNKGVVEEAKVRVVIEVIVEEVVAGCKTISNANPNTKFRRYSYM